MRYPPNDPKYCVVRGRFVNRASNEMIPLDEPVFILRARDMRAAWAIASYGDTCLDADHRITVQQRAEDFKRFAAMHPERMKEPDTDSIPTPPVVKRRSTRSGR